MIEIRLQKFLAGLGIDSRRNIEKLIKDNLVNLNNKLANLGDKVKIGDVIIINNKKIIVTKDLFISKDTKVLLYNKPVGEVCTRKDEKNRKTVFNNLPSLTCSKWINIGRLDINTSGLLIFTNNGDLANKLMHPSFDIEREYLVKISSSVNGNIIKRLLEGVTLSDGFAKFKKITKKSNDNKWFSVVLTEGRNREVRRLWESQGVMVNKLIRIRYGDVILPKSLAKGKFVDISDNLSKFKLFKDT